MSWADWIRRMMEQYRSSDDGEQDKPISSFSEIPERIISIQTGISTSQTGQQWLKIPEQYRCGPVTVDGNEAEQKTVDGMTLWYIGITQISEGHLRIACPTVTYTATIKKLESTDTPEVPDAQEEHDIPDTAEKPYHHYNPKAWHGTGSAIVLCPGQRVESVSIAGRELQKHGSLDKGREVWTDYHHPGLSGEVIMRAGSRVWKFTVSGSGMQEGDCW